MLLAHTVIPHHHHGDQFCIEKAHCESDALPLGHGHEHKHCGDAQHQDEENKSHSCFIDELVPASLENRYRFGNAFKYLDRQGCDIQLDLFTRHALTSIPITEVVTSIPYYKLFYSSRAFVPTGLRAPPIA